MDTNCYYAIQDKTWVNDPDGNEWDVFVVKEDNLPESDFKVGSNEICCTPASGAMETSNATSCCAPAPVGITK